MFAFIELVNRNCGRLVEPSSFEPNSDRFACQVPVRTHMNQDRREDTNCHPRVIQSPSQVLYRNHSSYPLTNHRPFVDTIDTLSNEYPFVDGRVGQAKRETDDLERVYSKHLKIASQDKQAKLERGKVVLSIHLSEKGLSCPSTGPGLKPCSSPVTLLLPSPAGTRVSQIDCQ